MQGDETEPLFASGGSYRMEAGDDEKVMEPLLFICIGRSITEIRLRGHQNVGRPTDAQNRIMG